MRAPRSSEVITAEKAKEWIMAVAEQMYAGRKAPLHSQYDQAKAPGLPHSQTMISQLGFNTAPGVAANWAAMVMALTGLDVGKRTKPVAVIPNRLEVEETPDMRPAERAERVEPRGLAYVRKRTVGNREYYVLR